MTPRLHAPRRPPSAPTPRPDTGTATEVASIFRPRAQPPRGPRPDTGSPKPHGTAPQGPRPDTGTATRW